ncbi:Alpha-ketoglutarate-dependent dioxygenase alkB -like protein [Trametes pubescens]|uniref:Alpha-ketoglutarate-dependent dioxygenase alkB-like protein n=1 Tax=Trametes pubescens TaxID=154538 RepID=A0A1M2VUS3_TRAPU|nr:Alpha-ketoglutarate-dependent dioxygenase alkB -like protein [Trametes pubescens]
MSTTIDLDEYLVPGTSNTYYIPEFVTEDEEEFLIRKPHEDGPAYHPVVATLSLGSHTVFHYYKYRPDDESSPSTQSEQSAGTTTAAGPMIVSGAGRPIDPTPVFSLLLEPRSLVITTSSLYTAHLHGINELLEDKFVEDGRVPGERIANFDMLKEGAEKAAVASGGILERGMRYSLTCRDVEKVHAGGGALFKKLRGQA